MENQVSIRLSHDDRVGVKWKWTFGCFLSQRSHFLWVLKLSRTTCKSRSGKAATTRFRRVGRGLSPPASHRSERDALASLGSHQANTPVIPSRQCTKRCALCRDNFCKNWLARVLWALKRLNSRSAQASSV